MEGLAPLKAEAAAFDELSAAVLHLQREMDSMRQVKPLGILARIEQERGDLEMVDDCKENVSEAPMPTMYKHTDPFNSSIHIAGGTIVTIFMVKTLHNKADNPIEAAPATRRVPISNIRSTRSFCCDSRIKSTVVRSSTGAMKFAFISFVLL